MGHLSYLILQVITDFIAHLFVYVSKGSITFQSFQLFFFHSGFSGKPLKQELLYKSETPGEHVPGTLEISSIFYINESIN